MSETPNSHYSELHREYVKNIVQFSYSFEKGDKDPLKRNLDTLKKVENGSMSGENAMRTYDEAKKLGLYNYPPVITRVYLGQLLLKVKSDGSVGFVQFIKMVESEVKSLHPLIQSQIGEVISLVKKYGRRGATKQFESMREKPKTDAAKVRGREADPIFGEDEQKPEKDEKFEFLENFGSGFEKLTDLDPFQTIIYKLLIEKGYKKFKSEILEKTGGWKKVFSRKEGIEAINRFKKWIVDTVKAMSFSKGPALAFEFDRRVGLISFPSLIIKVAGFKAKDYRQEARKQVVEGLKEMRPLIASLTKFPSSVYKIVGRTKSYADGQNRVFLNRFHRISLDRFKSTTGDQKYLYEFIALALDRIKDDDEFVLLSNDIKPVIADLLKGSAVVNIMSRSIFKKPVGSLTQAQIVSLLDYILPRTSLDEDQKESELNQKMTAVLKEAAGGLGSLRKTDPEKFRLIANILHIAKNDIVEIGNEKDVGKAKKKLSKFVERFNLARGIIGEDIMEKIKDSNKYLYMLLTQPEATIGFACAFNKNVAYVKKELENVDKAKKPTVVVSIAKDAKLTKQYLQKRFDQATQVKNISLIQQYGNQMRAVDMALGILDDCWTNEQFKEKERVLRDILNDTPYLAISKNAQKYIDLIASSNLQNEKNNYKSMLGVAYDVENYISDFFKNKLLKGQYAFAKERLSGLLSKTVASYGNEIENKNKTSGIDTYTYLSKNGSEFITSLITRINDLLKSIDFKDDNGRRHRLYGLNNVQMAYLKRNLNVLLANKVVPKVREAVGV